MLKLYTSSGGMKAVTGKAQVFVWCVFLIVLITIALSVYVSRFNPYVVTEDTRSSPIPEAETDVVGDVWHPLKVDFRSGKYTFAFVHIQKTGGREFAIHFQNIQKRGEPLCRIKRNITNYQNYLGSGVCPIDLPASKEMWLVSETTYGWPCGVHPFLIDWKSCLPNLFERKFGKRSRSFHFFTIIRHPVVRYISEFYHLRRVGNWVRHNLCKGKKYLREVNQANCLHKIRRNVSLKDFMSCPESWSNNRQTLILADVDKAGCLDPSAMSTEERDSILLATAKKNLEQMVFFGVTEYMKESVLLVEHRLDVKFGSFSQPLIKDLSIADLLYKVWNNSTLYKEISSINYLDMQLYEYGLKLFNQRLQQIRINIDFQKIDKEVYSLTF